MSFKRIVAAALVLALLLAGLTGAFLYTHLASEARARFWVGHTQRVIELNQSLFALLRDAEAAERGYVLDGDARFLNAYRRAARGIPRTQGALAALVADNPGETSRVQALNGAISRRMAFLESSVAPAQAGDLTHARAVLRGNEGHRMMSELRRQSDAISGVERGLLRDRIAAVNRTERIDLIIGLAVAALALLGLIGSVFYLAGANRRLTRAMAAAETARADKDASDALTKAVFANAADYLFVLEVQEGDQFLLADLNPALERALDVSAAEIRGRAINDLLPPEEADRLIAHYHRVRLADGPVLTRATLRFFAGGPRTLESILSPVRDTDGLTNRIVGSARDITDQLKTEERLREAQRMEAVGQLTGGVAHDFNNLLQVIRGNLELLEPAIGDSERARRRLNNAIHGADRAAQLTRQLLAFARRQPLAPQVINLSRLVGDMAELMHHTLGDGIAVETVVGADLWNTIADPAQVESAILNLAINARDAMPEGGRLTIEIANAAFDEAQAGQADGPEPGQYVLIAVSDTGAGMSPQTKARVFEPFFTTKADGKGSGLGLSMVYGFVRQSHGHVRLYSESGQGTTVKLYLPRSREAASPPPAPATTPARGENQTILVVEDDEAVRAAAVGMLETLGYACLEAANPQAALDILEDRLGRSAPVDLVFTDVVMPGTLKTRDFAERIRAIAPDLPILFTSGYTENAFLSHGRLDEGIRLLSKPYARTDLAAKVAALLLEASAKGHDSHP